MKIVIDCRMLKASGVGTYLNGCLPRFLDYPHTFLLFGNPQEILPFTRGKANIITEECTIRPFSPAEYLSFPRSLINKINQNDIYYSPYFNIPTGIKIPVFTTIHDIIFPDRPELVSPIGLWARVFFYRRGMRRSAAVFTVSDFSKSRIEYHLGKKKPVINASNAVNVPVLTANVQKKKIILFIGNIKKHKGLNVLLDAFSACLDSGLDYKLVITGSRDNFRSKDKKISDRLNNFRGGNLEFTGFIPEDEKNRLLAEASLLVQPSLYEGFGYPPLEAMLSGTQALISDIPVFREVFNNFPVTFFKAGDKNDLKEKIMELLKDKEIKPASLPDSLKNKYTFEKTVSKILSEIERNR